MTDGDRGLHAAGRYRRLRGLTHVGVGLLPGRVHRQRPTLRVLRRHTDDRRSWPTSGRRLRTRVHGRLPRLHRH